MVARVRLATDHDVLSTYRAVFLQDDPAATGGNNGSGQDADTFANAQMTRPWLASGTFTNHFPA